MPSLLGPVRAVMIFADDPVAAASWYAPLFGDPTIHTTAADDTCFAWFEAGGAELAFHPADPLRNPRGGNVVAYWSVASVLDARATLVSRGATPHRGPLSVDAIRSICQLVDPFGNVFGLDGPA